MFSMSQTCDEFETQLNDGSWEGGVQADESAGLSAAVCVSTLMMQRKVANRMDAWQVDGDSPLGEPLTTHPVTFDSCDESDTESIRRFPDSHFIDHANSSYAGSVCESVRSFGDHRRSLSTQSSVNGFKNSPKLCIHKTIGTDPVDDFDADTEKNEMVDRGCSPLPLECFDSDIDSEERYGLACDLWHFRPTILPGSETEIVKEKDLFQKSEERTWLKQLETARKDPWKKNKFKMDDEASIADEDTPRADTTWNLFKRIIWGEQAEEKMPFSKKC